MKGNRSCSLAFGFSEILNKFLIPCDVMCPHIPTTIMHVLHTIERGMETHDCVKKNRLNKNKKIV